MPVHFDMSFNDRNRAADRRRPRFAMSKKKYKGSKAAKRQSRRAR